MNRRGHQAKAVGESALQCLLGAAGRCWALLGAVRKQRPAGRGQRAVPSSSAGSAYALILTAWPSRTVKTSRPVAGAAVGHRAGDVMDDHNVIAAPDSGSFRHEVRPHIARAAEIFGDRAGPWRRPPLGNSSGSIHLTSGC